jgi:hypothetical protein
MDKDEEKPKYHKKYTDPEKRKKYQREYQIKRYYDKKALKNLDKVVISEEVEEVKTKEIPKEIQKIENQDPIFMAMSALKETLGPEDPVSKGIDKYGKYIVLGMSFVKGFAENMAAHQEEKKVNESQRINVQPPEGWNRLSDIERIARKYNKDGTESAWYLQGLAYERSMLGSDVEVAVRSHYPVAMERTTAGSMQAERNKIISRDETKSLRKENEGASMAELQRQSEQWDKKEEKKTELAEESKVESENPATEVIDPNVALNEIFAEMTEDNKRFLGLITNYFKNRSIEQFEKDLNNVDALIVQYKPFLNVLPVQTRTLFKSLSFEDWKSLLVSQDQEKLNLIVNKNLEEKLKNLIEELKAAL